MNQRLGRLSLAGICIVAAAVAGAYVMRDRRHTTSDAGPSPAILPLESLSLDRPGVLFRSARPDASFGKVVFLPLGALDGPLYVSSLTCQRVHFQGGRGVCLTLEDALVPPYAVSVFDDHFRPGPKTPLTGVPSRTRLSPDGRRAAFTVFEAGHSYAEDGFSTRTTIVDAASGAAIADLEQFDVRRDGVPFKAVDFNFWGVSFAADGNRFYATLRTSGTNYLIEGDVDRRAARVVRAGIECPSLSPDGQRLAFKKRVGLPGVQWHVAVLELATMQETVLDGEERSVDDQVEWLDGNHVLYFQSGPEGNNIWSLRTDRREPPHVLIPGGSSPALVR